MSGIEKLFLNAKIATMICEKNKLTNKFDCKLGFDSEEALLKNKKYTHWQTLCDKQMDDFIKSLGTVDTSNGIKHENDIRRWIIMERSNVEIYSFAKSTKIHFIKNDNLK